MLRKLLGRIPRNRLSAVKLVIVQGVTPSKRVKSVKVTEKNLIMSGSTGQVLWIMSVLLLSAVIRTGLDNRRGHE